MAKKMKQLINKKSQVTIFIIIAIIIIALIIGFFLVYYKTEIGILQPSITEPQQYIEKCARDATSEAIGIMLPQGGYLNPINYKLYEDNKVGYLCYVSDFYKPCIMQEPLYIKHLQEDITTHITEKIETCFQELKLELEKENYQIEMKEMNITTELATNIARIKIDRSFVMTKQEKTERINLFKSSLNSPLYNLAITAIDVANQEAKFCNFEYLGYMMLHPRFKIDKKSVSEGKNASKIYIIEDVNTEKKLTIAIRSCAVPPGF